MKRFITAVGVLMSHMGNFTYRYQCIGFNPKVTSNDASVLTVEKHNILVYQTMMAEL
jgi:hypothetical protein